MNEPRPSFPSESNNATSGSGSGGGSESYARLSQSISSFEESRNRSPLAYILAAVLLCGFVVIVWTAYNRGVETRNRTRIIPQITAQSPYKLRAEPVEPARKDHADKHVFDQLDGFVRPRTPVPATDNSRSSQTRLPDGRSSSLRPALQTSPQDALPAPAPSASSAPSAPSRFVPPPTAAEDSALATTAGNLNGGYSVQLSSLRSRREADAEWKRLVSAHGDVFANVSKVILRVDLGDRGIYHRLRVRGFSDAGQARTFCNRYKAKGGDCFVVRS